MTIDDLERDHNRFDDDKDKLCDLVLDYIEDHVGCTIDDVVADFCGIDEPVVDCNRSGIVAAIEELKAQGFVGDDGLYPRYVD